ncbi:MAG: class I SAM-dependent methyltransferase [Planctomycetota bacterium]|jgi:SAM-dependent methyltransferase|nr:class I SAM-dependent methyltransferase [Planctomycetota bacterium]
MSDRDTVRALANEYLERNEPTAWFEKLYAMGKAQAVTIPWADMVPNPHLTEWLDRQQATGEGRALTVGCGLGDDAEELSRRGYNVTAFDIAPTAIEWCRNRFPESEVDYVVADLFDTPSDWHMAFDLVFEAYTIQALPIDLRSRCIQSLAGLVSPGGEILIVSRGREDDEPADDLPWPASRKELAGFLHAGLKESSFEDYYDDEDPPRRRFRVVCNRGS